MDEDIGAADPVDPADPADPAADPAAGPADAAVLDRLAAMLEADVPPPGVVELAKRSFGLRRLDAELAELVGDSDAAGLAAVRGATRADVPRLLTFTSPALSLELEVTGSARGRRLLGQVLPPGPATVEVLRPDASPVVAEADDAGRFRLDGVGGGPVRVVCRRAGERPVATEWTLVD